MQRQLQQSIAERTKRAQQEAELEHRIADQYAQWDTWRIVAVHHGYRDYRDVRRIPVTLRGRTAAAA